MYNDGSELRNMIAHLPVRLRAEYDPRIHIRKRIEIERVSSHDFWRKEDKRKE